MNIVSLSTKYTYPLLIFLSLVCLYRGHNLPGGGFIGGLLASAAVVLYALTSSWEHALKKLPFSIDTFLGLGILTAVASGALACFQGQVFMSALWLPTFELPLLGKVKLGTPLLYDVGVYFTVIGFTVKCASSLGTYKY